MSKDTKHFSKSEVLNYLENEKKYNGQKDFITYIDFQVDDGKASMWQYDIFPGIQLLISDFETSSCFRNVNKQDVISINHCHIGRFECMFDKQNIIYMGEGDIAISSMNYQVKQSSIPLKRFFGSSIIIFPEVAEQNAFLQELAQEHGLSLTQLKANFKEIYGVSPYAYAKTYKMNVAAKMLVETDERIGDIALELSYKNPSKFADAFESVMGCSPSEYRKRYSKT